MTRSVLFVSAALFLGPQVASAQNPSATPQGGLFGDGADSAARSRLDFTVALAEAVDSEPPPEFRSRFPQSGPQSGGYSTMLIAAADYERTRRRADVSGTALTAFRYYQGLDQVSAESYSAGLGATVRLPKRTIFEVNQMAAYSPSYLYQLFPTAVPAAPGDAIPAAPDYRVDASESYSYATQMRLSFGSDRGNRVRVAALINRTDFERQSVGGSDLATYEGRATWSHGVGRSSAFSAEYEYRISEFGQGETSIQHRLRIGGEYSRALSASRRAVFRFNVAPSTLVTPASPTGTLYGLEGDASVDYRFRRSWSASGSYSRGVEYLAVFRTPVFRDAARLELGGLVSRRLDVSASAGYAIGESALTRGTETFDTYTGNVRVRYALERSFALYSEYLYYYYDMRGQRALAPGLPRVFEQQGVRAGLMLWIPVLGR